MNWVILFGVITTLLYSLQVFDINQYTDQRDFFTNEGLYTFVKKLDEEGLFSINFQDSFSQEDTHYYRSIRAGNTHSLYIIHTPNPLFLKLYFRKEYEQWKRLLNSDLIVQYKAVEDDPSYPKLVLPLYSCNLISGDFNLVGSFFDYIPGMNLIEWLDTFTIKKISEERLREVFYSVGKSLRLFHDFYRRGDKKTLQPGDFSFSNVMVDANLDVFFIDCSEMSRYYYIKPGEMIYNFINDLLKDYILAGLHVSFSGKPELLGIILEELKAGYCFDHDEVSIKIWNDFELRFINKYTEFKLYTSLSYRM